MDVEPETDDGTVTLCPVVVRKDNTLTECREHTGSFAWKKPLKDGTCQLIPLKGDVRFNDVVFGYTRNEKILNDISLYAKPGQKIAFVWDRPAQEKPRLSI